MRLLHRDVEFDLSGEDRCFAATNRSILRLKHHRFGGYDPFLQLSNNAVPLWAKYYAFFHSVNAKPPQHVHQCAQITFGQTRKETNTDRAIMLNQTQKLLISD